MSADNGVYILKTKGPEWRVAYAHRLEDFYYYEIFKNSPVFTVHDHAEWYAEGLADQHLYLEYGVLRINSFQSIPFEDLKRA